ncbi:MAG: bifunctional 5,10-methylenetetrahydrofolate dehydrogenase/5,10-methenyltetrahydrofolate cyclohydrolase [Cyanobacteria bacterium J06635_10]
MKIDGNLIKEHLKNECKQYQQQFQGKEISIVRFEVPAELNQQRDELTKRERIQKAKYKAALVSENQKVKTFESFGVKANRVTLNPEETSVEQFQQIIQSINEDENVKAAIVQLPVPPEFYSSIKQLAPEKDIDCVRGEPNELFSSPATAEGVARIVESYAQPDSNVAVIGGDGFIGRGVRNYLEENGISSFVLEQEDDKSRTNEADIVVSVTGVAGLATPYILPQHRLVVDSGFTPGENEGDLPSGDVDRSAYDIPDIITPVPGGIGPTEMAILAERFVKMELNIELPKWNYQELAQEQQKRAAEVTSIAENLIAQVEEYALTEDSGDINPSINPQARQLFDSLKNNLSQEENKTTLIGNKYKIVVNTQRETFSISRAEEKTLLVKKNLSNNQIEINRGLTANDIQQWKEIDRLLPGDNGQQTAPQQQSNNDIER